MKTALEVLTEIQAKGPEEDTPSGREKWYDEILFAAHGILKIEGVLDTEEQAETVGDWDPIEKKFIPGKHDKLPNLQEET